MSTAVTPSNSTSKRKATDDSTSRNVRAKPSEPISLNISEDQLYLILARLPPEDDLFKTFIQDIIKRSAPEKRFQEAMLEDIVGRLCNGGMSDDNAQRAKKILNDSLMHYLTQKFSEGIGRSQPTIKHLRNVFLRVLQAFERSHPGQTPKGLAADMYKLFAQRPDTEAPQLATRQGSESPVDSPFRDEASARAASPLSTNGFAAPLEKPTIVSGDSFSTVTKPNPYKAQDQADDQVARVDDQYDKSSTLASVNGNSGPVASDTARIDLSEEQPCRPNSASLDKPSGKHSSDSMHPRSAITSKEQTTVSSGIDDLIGEFAVQQQPSTINTQASGQSRSTDMENGVTKASATSTDPIVPPFTVTQPSHPVKSEVSLRANSTKSIATDNIANGTSSVKRPVDSGRRSTTPSLDSATAKLPTYRIDASLMTCWYWYYKRPPCDSRYGCRYLHKLTSYVADRDRGKPPIPVDQNIDPPYSPKNPIRSDELPESHSTTIKGRAAEKSTTTERDTSTSKTPILDMFWNSHEPITYTNRERVLDAIMTDILSRGLPSDFITDIKGKDGKSSNLSLTANPGLKTRLFGLFNTFAKDPVILCVSMESHLRSFVLANKAMFPEMSGALSAEMPDLTIPSDPRRRSSDLYRPVDIGGQLRGDDSSAMDYKNTSLAYDSYKPVWTRPTHNEPGMTCPYWLSRGCNKGYNCKFRHEITSWVAAEAGKGKPRPLNADGSIGF